MTDAQKRSVAGGSPVRCVACPTIAPDPALPHVLLAVDQLSRTLGGGERVLLRLARLLPEHGFRASILTLSLDPASPALADPPCPVYVLPLQRTYDLNALRAAGALRHFLRAERIVLVQTFFESSDLWVGAVSKTVPGVKLIWSRRDLGILRGRKHELAYRLLHRLPDRVFAVSDQVHRHVVETDGVPPDRVLTVYNGIDPAPESLPSNDGISVHITSVGNLRAVKGFDVLVEAAAGVVDRFPRTRFTVAGETLDPGYAAALITRIAALGLQQNVELLGGVWDVARHLRTADIFCLPSRSEGLSNALLESMAVGLPAVATDVGGNAECVLSGQSGLIVPADDVAALRDALLKLVESASLRQEMGNEAHRRAGYLFSNEAMLKHTVSAYRALLA